LDGFQPGGRRFTFQPGQYEKSTRRMLPLLVVALVLLLSFISAPSAIYSRVLQHPPPRHELQKCNLEVPPIAGIHRTSSTYSQSLVTYRLAMEIILPYLLPLILISFPYILLILGLMRGLETTDHAHKSSKLSVVAVIWVLTSYLMLQVPTVLRCGLSIFSVWHRLTSLLDAEDDPRVPMFQTYIHMASYIFTILWSIIRACVCFKYSHTIRKGLGP